MSCKKRVNASVIFPAQCRNKGWQSRLSHYTYICSIHRFSGQIITVDPTPPPPTIRLLSLAVSDNVVLRSTGTNGWSLHPEYSTNLTTTNWFALSVLSNRLLNGINETFCGRLPGSNVFLRIRSQPN